MKTPAYDLLEGAIDYAGLYPPAKHPLPTAVDEYLDILNADGEWLTTRFVCPAAERDAVAQAFRDAIASFEGDPIPLALVGAADQIDRDAEALLRSDIAAATAYEVRIPTDQIEAAMPKIKKLLKRTEDRDIAVFLEFGWGDDLVEAMHRAAEMSEEIGFKARTGGVTADAFPTPAQLAQFLAEAAALEAPFKFTAGLHEPIRYRDEALGVMRHGFVNALVAAGLAVTQYLSADEIRDVLEITDPAEFVVGDDGIEAAGHRLSLADIHEFREVFGGFGSCSVQEPLDGLRRIGWR